MWKKALSQAMGHRKGARIPARLNDQAQTL
jgi:hypothetical protein